MTHDGLNLAESKLASRAEGETMAAAAAAAAEGPLCPLLPPGTPDRRLVLLPTEPEDAAAAAPLRQVRLLLRLLKRPGNTQQGNH